MGGRGGINCQENRLCCGFDSIHYHYLSAQVPSHLRPWLPLMFLAALIPRQISGGATPAAWAPPGPLSAAPSQPGRAQLLQALGPSLYLHAQTSAWRAAGRAPPRTPGKLAGSAHPAPASSGVRSQPGCPPAEPLRLAAGIIKTPTFQREERTKKPTDLD